MKYIILLLLVSCASSPKRPTPDGVTINIHKTVNEEMEIKEARDRVRFLREMKAEFYAK